MKKELIFLFLSSIVFLFLVERFGKEVVAEALKKEENDEQKSLELLLNADSQGLLQVEVSNKLI